MVCHRFVVAVLAMVLSPFSIAGAQEDRPSPLQIQRERQQQSDTASQQRQNAQQAANVKLLIDELKNLTPGGLPEGSELEQEMRKVVDLFLDQKFEEAEATLTAAEAKFDVLPPKELLLAGLWFAVKNTKRGAEYLETSAVENPEYPAIFTAYARFALNQNRLADSLAQLEKADRLLVNGKYSEVEIRHFRTIYLETMIDLKILREQYAQARGFVDALQAIAPDVPKVLLAYAELAFYGEEIDKSLDYLKRYREKVPETLVPELALANWYSRTGKAEQAADYFNKAAQLYPNDPNTQVQFAQFSIGKEDFRAASVAIEKVEKVKGESDLTMSLKAKIAFAKQAYSLAETYYGKLAARSSRNFDMRNLYALSLAESEDEEKRKQALQIAGANFQQMQNSPVAVAALGWVAFKNDRVADAEQLLRRAAQTRNLPPEVSYYLAALLHSQGNTQQAKLFLEPALKSETFFLYRAAAKELLQKIDESDLPVPKK